MPPMRPPKAAPTGPNKLPAIAPALAPASAPTPDPAASSPIFFREEIASVLFFVSSWNSLNDDIAIVITGI